MSYSDRNYGAGDPDCPICKGVGYVRHDVPEGHPHFGKVFDCQCRLARVEAERQAHLRKLGGLEHLADKTLASFNPEGVGISTPERNNLQRSYEGVADYTQNPQGWLVITGGYGCGKTHLAAAIANAQIEAGNKVLFVTAPDLLDHLRSAFSPDVGEGEGYDARFEEVRTTPLLILDDLGVENQTPWVLEKLYQLLNYRYNARLPTVITTNYNLADLELRLRSRLSDPDLAQIIGITAPDYRRAGIAANRSDLNGISLYGHMTFEAFDLRRQNLNKDQRDSLRRAYEAAKAFAQTPGGWLVLAGEHGTGKTHLAAAIANAQVMQGTVVLFVTVPDLLDHLRATFAPDSHISYDKRFNEVKTAPLLILDDLGAGATTTWAREKLRQLFNYRYVARLPTVITTADELEKLDPYLTTRMFNQDPGAIVAILTPPYLREHSKR